MLPKAQLPADQPAPPPRRTRNDRKHVRMDLRIDVCIRHPQRDEEVTVTENVSRGGFCFKSSRQYVEGWITDVALPYMLGSANIFAPARIVHAAKLPAEAVTVYGASYIPMHKAWSGS